VEIQSRELISQMVEECNSKGKQGEYNPSLRARSHLLQRVILKLSVLEQQVDDEWLRYRQILPNISKMVGILRHLTIDPHTASISSNVVENLRGI
jgi:hypothetical protein